VVLSQLESLRGTVDVFTTKGQGTRFVLSVPLTLTTIPAILVRSGRQTYAISSGQIQKLIRFPQDNLLPSQGGWVLEHERRPLPVFRLSDVLGREQTPQPADAPLLGIVVRVGGSEAIVVVDKILSEPEIVLKNLGHRVRRTRFVSGASLLASGEIALLLNLQNLLASAGEKEYAQRWTQRKEEAEHPSKRLLLVDDSLTTRSLLKNILEDAGYAVTVAVDGQDAWEKLSRDAFELIVSDVDMPRMNGFQLTRRIRDTETTKMLPVVLVTARDTEDDKIQGVRSGADAYLVKSTFQQTNLLETISQLL